MKKVVCVGACAWDTLLTGVDKKLMNIDSILADEYFASLGGDAANGAISFSRLGFDVSLMCNIGDDSNGESIIKYLKDNNVETKYIHIDKSCNTASPIILVDETGDRHIIRIPRNANHHFDLSMIDIAALENFDHLHFASANVIPKIDGEPLAELFRKAKEYGLTISLDASYAKDNNSFNNIKDALNYCDIFIPSLQEASEYARSDDLERIIEFFSVYPLKVFGIKLGEKGALITDFKNRITIPSLYNGTPIDTTGAGDAFIAGFVSGWLMDYELEKCAYLASAQAASVLQEIGACVSAGTLDDAYKLLSDKKILEED